MSSRKPVEGKKMFDTMNKTHVLGENKQEFIFQTSTPSKHLCQGIVNTSQMRHPRNNIQADQVDAKLHISRFLNACKSTHTTYNC